MAKLIVGENDLLTWCKNNGEWGQKLIDEWFGQYEDGTPVAMDEISYGSKKKVKWKCIDGHIWDATCKDRTLQKYGCLICSGHKIIKGVNDLETTHPILVKDWDINNTLKSCQVTCGSHYKANWVCAECGHKWNAVVKNRVSGNGCPECTKRKLAEFNRTPKFEESLEYKYPDIAAEWDYEKNDKAPNEVFAHSGDKVWWKCLKGHSWETRIADRTSKNGTGCPHCSYYSTSYPEQYLYCSIKQIWSDTKNRAHDIDNLEIDILNVEHKLCIEYSGTIWHEGKDSTIKIQAVNRVGIKFIEIIDNGKYLDIYINNTLCKSIMGRNDTSLRSVIDYLHHIGLIPDISGINYDLSRELALERCSGKRDTEDSFGFKFKHLLLEWDYTKNKGIDPMTIAPYSGIEAHWVCPECKHSYKAKISQRTSNNSGCPLCNGTGTINTGINDLESKCYELSKEWNFNKNIKKPSDIRYSSHDKAWWKCQNPNCKHEWEATICNRYQQKSGCPNCGYNWYKAQTGQPQKLKKMKPRSQVQSLSEFI